MKTASQKRGGSESTVSFHELLVRPGPEYLQHFGPCMPARQREVLQRILRCRTPALGGQLFACPDCGAHHFRYHSCNDRHGPLCGQSEADDWLEREQSRLLLPTPYFLVTFTLPEPLRVWMRSHPKIGCNLLFRTSAHALQDLAANSKHLGGSLALLGVLHTWSRTLIYHPHVHYLVPGGALSLDQRQWVPAKDKFLLPVHPLSDHFRHLFYQALQKHHPEALRSLPRKIWKQRWVVHSQPAGSGREALRYLSRYVFKTATGNRPLEMLSDGRVGWPYRDSDTGQSAHLDLMPEELLRRFLQHVLPSGCHRVRLFGWFHPVSRKKLNRVRALLKQSPLLTQPERDIWQPGEEIFEAVLPIESKPAPAPQCPHCKRPMVLVGSWHAGPLIVGDCASASMNLLTTQSNHENAAQTASRIALSITGSCRRFLATSLVNAPGSICHHRKSETFATPTRKQTADANDVPPLTSCPRDRPPKHFPQAKLPGYPRC